MCQTLWWSDTTLTKPFLMVWFILYSFIWNPFCSTVVSMNQIPKVSHNFWKRSDLKLCPRTYVVFHQYVCNNQGLMIRYNVCFLPFSDVAHNDHNIFISCISFWIWSNIITDFFLMDSQGSIISLVLLVSEDPYTQLISHIFCTNRYQDRITLLLDTETVFRSLWVWFPFLFFTIFLICPIP